MLTWLWTQLSEGGPQTSISGRALCCFPELELNRLLRARVLVEQRKADSWSVCTHCDCGLDARPIRQVDDGLRACCPRDAAEDVPIDELDLLRFSIDPGRLAEDIAASGGLNGDVVSIADGIWRIGDAPFGGGVFLCSDVRTLEARGTIAAIRATSSNPGPIMVIATEFGAESLLHLHEMGLKPRRLAECFASTEAGKERFILDSVAGPGILPRLVVSKGSQMATLDGRRLDLPRQMFALFQQLAEQAGRRDSVLKKQSIEEQTGRAANGIVRDLRESLMSCGLTKEEAYDFVATVQGYGYRLGLEPSEVIVEF